ASFIGNTGLPKPPGTRSFPLWPRAATRGSADCCALPANAPTTAPVNARAPLRGLALISVPPFGVEDEQSAPGSRKEEGGRRKEKQPLPGASLSAAKNFALIKALLDFGNRYLAMDQSDRWPANVCFWPKADIARPLEPG